MWGWCKVTRALTYPKAKSKCLQFIYSLFVVKKIKKCTGLHYSCCETILYINDPLGFMWIVCILILDFIALHRMCRYLLEKAKVYIPTTPQHYNAFLLVLNLWQSIWKEEESCLTCVKLLVGLHLSVAFWLALCCHQSRFTTNSGPMTWGRGRAYRNSQKKCSFVGVPWTPIRVF